MATVVGESEFPSELLDKIANFHRSLEDVETVLRPLLETTVSENREKFQSLDRAKFDLVAAYALNSLFWMYLNTNGEDPREHAIKVELERIRGYMTKVKEITDKAKQPRLNVAVAKRFLTSSLWTATTEEDGTTDGVSDKVDASVDETNARKPKKNKKQSSKKQKTSS